LEGSGLRFESEIDVPERIDGDPRHLARERDAAPDVFFRVREDFENANELLPVTAHFVDAFENAGGRGAKVGVVEQGLERLTRPFVGGIEKEYLAVVF